MDFGFWRSSNLIAPLSNHTHSYRLDVFKLDAVCANLKRLLITLIIIPKYTTKFNITNKKVKES